MSSFPPDSGPRSRRDDEPAPGRDSRRPAAFVLGGGGAAAGLPGAIPAAARWRGWPEMRADLRSSLLLAVGVAVAGPLCGLVWWALAPRADFRITDSGPVLVGNPPAELSVADDSVFVLVLAAFGLIVGVGAWWLRRRRGVTILGALALGPGVGAVGAWQLGELLGRGPTQAQLTDVGSLVTTPLTLASVPALAVGPFAAVLAYLVAVLLAGSDDLARADADAGADAGAGAGADGGPRRDGSVPNEDETADAVS